MIRHALPQDVPALARLEAASFPAAEAASEASIRARVAAFPEHFWLLEESGQLISFINGMVTDEPTLTDTMYDHTELHKEQGAWQMLFSVVTDPDKRHQGYASAVMRQVIADCRADGRKGIVLTCKETLLPFYRQFGFANEGVSASSHGGAVWYQMRLRLDVEPGQLRHAYFAGGCFWCITPSFREMPGVLQVISGYSGGQEVAPRYEEVKAQRTGHRETIAVTYDPSLVSYEALLTLFLNSVDPFDGEGQYIDRGKSYTLAVYYQDEVEHAAALRAIQVLSRQSGREVPIPAEPFTAFYPAEEYHQDYDLKHPEAFHRELVESGRVSE